MMRGQSLPFLSFIISVMYSKFRYKLYTYELLFGRFFPFVLPTLAFDIISTYINTKMCVCLFVCLFAFFSAIWNPIGISFGTKLPYASEMVLKQ